MRAASHTDSTITVPIPDPKELRRHSALHDPPV